MSVLLNTLHETICFIYDTLDYECRLLMFDNYKYKYVNCTYKYIYVTFQSNYLIKNHKLIILFKSKGKVDFINLNLEITIRKAMSSGLIATTLPIRYSDLFNLCLYTVTLPFSFNSF